MDGYLNSHGDVNKAAHLASGIVAVYNKASFEMRGCSISNNSKVLRLLPQEWHAAQPSEVKLSTYRVQRYQNPRCVTGSDIGYHCFKNGVGRFLKKIMK